MEESTYSLVELDIHLLKFRIQIDLKMNFLLKMREKHEEQYKRLQSKTTVFKLPLLTDLFKDLLEKCGSNHALLAAFWIGRFLSLFNESNSHGHM